MAKEFIGGAAELDEGVQTQSCRTLRLQDIRRNSLPDKELARLLSKVRRHLIDFRGHEGLGRSRLMVVRAMAQVMGVTSWELESDPIGWCHRYAKEVMTPREGQIAPPRLVFPLGEGRGALSMAKLMPTVLSRLEGMPAQVSMSSRVRIGEGV